MKFCTWLVALVCMTGLAVADQEAPVSIDGPTDLMPPEDAFYCQQPHSGWSAGNASTGFNSEEADDIPAEYAGMQITMVTLYHAQWGGGYTDPTGLIINFYDEACPPEMVPVVSHNITFGALVTEMVYSGSWFVMEMTATLPEPYTIGTSTSLGGVIDNYWGEDPPYNGLCFTDDGVIAGCGGGYWDGTYWGSPRWTPFADYFGNYDMAYCLTGGGGTPAVDATWSQIKSLY